ncbi:MAG TPA: 4Fe-4S dicluster domain-containing protein, partial [Bryobacteraceae bacterium]|nr:4Fe-4S dicluster domain-containing protein [Bryobacteraceae bacterium]
VDVRFRRVHTAETGTFPAVRTQALSLACNHCESAYCIRVCPTRAIQRRADGFIVVNAAECAGCGICREFCPYDVPRVNPKTSTMQKCDGCFARIEQDLQPACVTLCPTGALRFGDWDEIQREGSSTIDGFNNRAQTRPRIRFVTSGWTAGQEAR